MSDKYIIHYWFEWGGQCLWGGDERTRTQYGYAIQVDALPLSASTIQQTKELGKYHDTALNWADPMAPSPWSKEDNALFEKERKELFEVLKKELEADFEVLDGRELSDTWKPDE